RERPPSIHALHLSGLSFSGMGATRPQPPPRFSPDGVWWWDGKEWKPAISPDRRWRWNGYTLVPNHSPGASTGSAAGITTGVVLGACYPSVPQRDDPKLRGIPVAVAGRSRRAVIMGASYEARSYGVRSAMPLHEAMQLCPQLTVMPPDGARYREASRLVHQIFRRFTSPELVEGVALDEAYLD